MENLIKISEAAELLNVHQATVRRWCEEGKLSFYRLGNGCVRLNKGDVEEFVEASKVKKVS